MWTCCCIFWLLSRWPRHSSSSQDWSSLSANGPSLSRCPDRCTSTPMADTVAAGPAQRGAAPTHAPISVGEEEEGVHTIEKEEQGDGAGQRRLAAHFVYQPPGSDAADGHGKQLHRRSSLSAKTRGKAAAADKTSVARHTPAAQHASLQRII